MQGAVTLFETTMSTIKLTVTPLPPDPASYEGWRSTWRDCLSTYDKIFNAERHAAQQVEAHLTNKEAKDNLMSARVTGYLVEDHVDRVDASDISPT